MVRWGSAPSFEQREWDQCPKFSLCQPIASRERALDIWPCHPVDCRWCISQLGSILSSMKLWEWLGGEKKGRQRERRNGGGCLIRCYWSIARDRVWQSFQSWTHLFSIVFVFSSEATACLPESLRYFHSNVNFSITDHLTSLKRHWCSNLDRFESVILHTQVISQEKSSPTSCLNRRQSFPA